MGTRYHVAVDCPKCKFHEDDVYYAPTCGFIKWTCPKCNYVVDLEDYTGISVEEAHTDMSNLVEKFKNKG
jgi:phage FluMu protein Com